MAAISTRSSGVSTDRRTIDAIEGTGQLLLNVLQDDSCRSILVATSDDPLSAKEIAERCDLSLSTTYRKLDELKEAGCLEEGLRLRRSGKHTNEYERRIAEVHLSVEEDEGFALELGRTGSSAGSNVEDW